MAFDTTTRNRLARFVSEARGIIAEEFTEQFQSLYGISAGGVIAPVEKLAHLDDAGLSIAVQLRERIDYLEKSHPDDKGGTRAAVERLARELAFTILNRLAAVRMAEKREIIVESVGKGYQSKGFKVFETVAGSALGDTYNRYRRYLFCLFDELAVDLGILFSRRSLQSLLFPRETALLELLGLLNAPELEDLWAEDETIGWIYQYYNDPAERKKMRDESAAPRNSRELAVRNQFFTPRYVVEFLTDNTLGRIWYEMTKGDTRLKEQCRYMVRRPNEIFLGDDEVAASPLPFDQPLASIIGDPREAHAKIFLQEDPNAYEPPTSWKKEAFEGNFENLPEDSDDPWTRWVGAAIPPHQIEVIIGEKWKPFEDDDKLSRLTKSIYEGNPDPETRKLPVAWAILSAAARTSQFAGGYERPYWRKLWSYFRHLAQTWQRSGAASEDNLSQEDLLKQPVHIPHRPLKDPRTILMLDPACGSMHFGLYAFDLFEAIYDEAWDIAKSGILPAGSHDSFAPFVLFVASFASKDEFLREVPRLIIENNLHGIDIDPRCTQIAGLSLWLRAQKAWHRLGLKPTERPAIKRSNIVCAEPMPGEKEMLREFVEREFPAAEQAVFLRLLEGIFDKMQLAGEAGSLLKIEEEISSAISDAKKLWKTGPQIKQSQLFCEPDPAKQKELTIDFSGITDEQFWDTAESRIYGFIRKKCAYRGETG